MPKWRMAPSPHGSYWKDGMAKEHDLAEWNADALKGGNLAPQAQEEKDKPITIDYDELVKRWQKQDCLVRALAPV